jgi:hypothetical protein
VFKHLEHPELGTTRRFTPTSAGRGCAARNEIVTGTPERLSCETLLLLSRNPRDVINQGYDIQYA